MFFQTIYRSEKTILKKEKKKKGKGQIRKKTEGRKGQIICQRKGMWGPQQMIPKI